MSGGGAALVWETVIGAAVLFVGCTPTPNAPSPQPNTPPTLSVGFVGPSTCSPLPDRPCGLTVAAIATDREGGPINYRWSGCAAGSAPQAQCLVDALAEVTAAVEVTDAQGVSARAEVHGKGTNQAPEFGISYTWVAPGGGSIEFLGWVRDPDEGFLWGSQYCVSASASGACGKASLRCPSSGPELILLRAAASGTCQVNIEVKDSWTEVGNWLLTFDINNPSVTSITPNSR